MSATPNLTRLTDDQAGGTDPRGNAWLSASAGTGKTQVLTARVLRLLLEGADPRSILCITFTKAGASEMARRIRERLARWVQLSDLDLQKDLFAIHARDHRNPAVLARARTLFARVIDAPGGGLAIQTIHSFCQSLLAAFPEEAGLTPGFRPLEDQEIVLLRRDVLTDLVDRAQMTGDQAFLDRLQMVSREKGEAAATAYLYRCAQAVAALDRLPAEIAPWLRHQFALPVSTPADWAERACANDAFDIAGLRAIAAANAAWGTPSDDEAVVIFKAWIDADPAGRVANLPGLLDTMVTKSGTLRKLYVDGRLASVGDLASRLAGDLQTILATAAHMTASDMLAAGLEVGRVFARAMRDRKQRDGLVDFNDLIERTVHLLAESGRAEWIRYKLDSRIDHVLVDEAQDTNSAQWDIIEALTEEFFDGAGAKESEARTCFVVGDFKQAIYGFQGTDPRYFERARLRFALKGEYAERRFADLAIDINFRSSPPVLAVVDQLIERITPDQLGLAQSPVRHTAFADTAGGRVVLWPAEPADADDGPDADTSDADRDDGWIDSATRRVADRIARSIRGWIETGIEGTPVRAGDVMVLVRKRRDLAALIVSRLQRHGVVVAGVDRLRLQTPMAVQDLLAAARFALQPLDDLNLANLLVSPLIGWSHDDLIAYGWRQDDDGRSGRLWPHMRSQPGIDEKLAPLREILNLGGFATPYRFFETLLSGPLRGRARLLARLGNAARDPIEELVSQALAFGTREGTSLHQFLRWFDMGDVDIKREADSVADEVRVMTVHGAKGLQAPIVILADAAGDPLARRMDGPSFDFPDIGTLPLLPLSSAECPDAVTAAASEAAAAEMREHWRLLYVAMTRAERMLFVTGSLGRRAKAVPEFSWYRAIDDTLAAMDCRWQPVDGAWGQQRALIAKGREPARAMPKSAPAAPIVIPDWALVAPLAEPRPLRPLAPSAIGDGDALDVPRPPASPVRARAAERGTLMHALFERLPPVAPSARRDSALQWLSVVAAGFTAGEREDMADAVLAIVDSPDHANLFGPDSLAEVPFSALVDGQVITGTIDRLTIDDQRVTIVDFKTGSGVPGSVDDIPRGYLLQMAAYVAALEVIFPGHHVDAALLFTAGPRLWSLPPDLLAAHKPGFGNAKANSAERA